MHTLKKFISPDCLVADVLERLAIGFAKRITLDSTSVLDLGCGAMPYRRAYADARHVGAETQGEPYLLIERDGPLSFNDVSFDVVASFRVLEHARDVANYLKSAKRALKSDGRHFLSTHGVWPYHPRPTDYWRYKREGLQETIEDSGFQIGKITPFRRLAAWMSMFPALLPSSASWLLAPLNLCVNLVDQLTLHTTRDTNAAVYAVQAVRRP